MSARWAEPSKYYGCWSGLDVSISRTSSKAARTAAITKAENVQFLFWIAFSTPSTTSLGKRIVLLIVGGVDGIWNLPMDVSSQYICITISLYHYFSKVCIAFAMQLWYDGTEVMSMAELCLDCWNKLTDSEYSPKCFLFSEEPDLCEECGEWKTVIIRFKRRYLVAEWLHERFNGFSDKQKSV